MRYILEKIVYGVFALAELFLGLRLVLKLFAANPDNSFVSWVYETSGVILDPFRGIFPVQVFKSTYVLEFSTIFAMVIYAVIAMVIIYVIDFLGRPRTVAKK